MDWSDERFVRLYTRDTPEWLCWSWQARALWPHLIRKADRSGVIANKLGPRGLAALIGMPVDVVEAGLPDLLADGCLAAHQLGYVIPNYIEAQETPQSDKQRQRESRERRRVVTKRDSESRNVTDRHAASRDVTPIRSDPIRSEDLSLPRDPAVPSPAPAPEASQPVRPEPPEPPETGDRDPKPANVIQQPPAPILPASIARADARRRLIGDAWQLAGDAFRELGREGIEPHAFDPWAGMPGAGDEGMKLLIAHVDRLLMGEPPDADRVLEVIRRRIAVAAAEGRAATPRTRRWMTPMRIWDPKSFAKGAETSPEQVKPRAGPPSSAARAQQRIRPKVTDEIPPD